MSKKISDILRKAGKGVFTEEVLGQIETTFNEAVESKVDSQVKLAVEAAEKSLDSEYTSKLKKLLEAIDKNHSNKFARAIRAFDMDRTRKLKRVVEHYEKTLNEDAKSFRDELTTSMSNYLELALEEVIPTKTIQEAARNRRAFDLLSEFRKTLSIDAVLQNESVRSALLDGKRQLTEHEKQSNILLKENLELRKKNNDLKKMIFLEKKTMNFDADKRKYITDALCEKPLEFIKENFDFTSRMYDKQYDAKLENLREEAVQDSVTKGVIVEKKDYEEEAPRRSHVSNYVRDMERYF